MNNNDNLTRKGFFAGLVSSACAIMLTSCDRLSQSGWFPKVLGAGEKVTKNVHGLIVPAKAMAQEFRETDLSPEFRSNGTRSPRNAEYKALAKSGFANYRLDVSGLVERPRAFSLKDIRNFPSRTQITRHDCVEGWSAIGKWKGARLGYLLEAVHLKASTRYIVFYCYDPLGDDDSSLYYESIGLEDAFHPQTILAYELNGKALPVANGAPLRLRLERQLGYKMAKYVMSIEAVEDFSGIARGKGGYWEDRGYEWYAGI